MHYGTRRGTRRPARGTNANRSPRAASMLASCFRLPFPRTALGMDDADQVFQSPAFGSQHTPPQTGETVIAAPRVILFGRWPRGGFFDKIFIYQALERAVHRRRPEPQLAAGAIEDLLHDAVAMLLLAVERQQDMEPMRLKGEKTVGIGQHLYQ